MQGWWSFAHLTTILGFVLAISLAGRILRERRSPGATAAWLLAIALMPWLGMPAYLLLADRAGGPRSAAGARRAPLAADLDGVVSATDRLLRIHGAPPPTTGNRVSLCSDGEHTYRALVDLIEAATRRIRVAMFIVHPDEVGRDFITRLARRAADGVEVRLLLDSLGSFTTSRQALHPLVEAGGDVRWFGPMLRHPLGGRANQRNHRKIVVADGERALAGGINVASEYMGPVPRADRWRDLAFVVEGPAARDLEDVVISDWAAATGTQLARGEPPDPASGGALVQTLASGPGAAGDALYALILSTAFSVRRRLWLVTPYFVPDDGLARAFAMAAERGVDVRILVPKRSNHRLADLARGRDLRDLQSAGARVLLHGAGMVHAKALVADAELAMIGSANLDLRSLRSNYEISALFYGAAEVDAVARWFEELAGACQEGVDRAGIVRELVEGIVRVASPLL